MRAPLDILLPSIQISIMLKVWYFFRLLLLKCLLVVVVMVRPHPLRPHPLKAIPPTLVRMKKAVNIVIPHVMTSLMMDQRCSRCHCQQRNEGQR